MRGSLFLVIFTFYFCLIRAQLQNCKFGQWQGSDGKCYECPSDFMCSGSRLPTPCPSNTRALPGSAKCCPMNTNCPDGFVVDNNECTCVSLNCPRGSTMIKEFNRLFCQENVLNHDNNKCRQCAFGMTQNENCDCSKIQGCEIGSSFWKSGSNDFVCMPPH